MRSRVIATLIAKLFANNSAGSSVFSNGKPHRLFYGETARGDFAPTYNK
jgi:hypothetical protein